jgi:hypothetical protein
MHTSIKFALLSIAAACGGSSSSKPDAGPDIDAPPDTPGPGTAIVVETDVAPSLIAYRDGASGWKVPKMIDVDTFELDVHGPYIVTVACDDGDGAITTYQAARTLADDRELYLFCYGPLGTTHAVTGTMVQPGTVNASFYTDRSTTPSWTFDLAIEPGTTDVVAFDANQIVARRGVTVTGATQITPALDLTQGATLVATPLTATNAAAGETINATINVTTANGTIARVFRGSAAATKVVPTSFLQVGDRQSAAVTASSAGSGTRTLRRSTFRAGDPTDFTMPAALGAVTYTQAGADLRVSWSTLPAHDTVDVTLDSFTEDFTTFFYHVAEISPAYIAETGATSITLDTDIPGYRPEWRIDFTKEYFRSVAAIKFLTGASATSARSEIVNAPESLVPAEARRSRAFERHLLARER